MSPDTPETRAPVPYDVDDDFDLDDFDYDQITFLAGGPELLDDIELLWLMLRQHHADMAPMWSEGLLQAEFEKRKAGLVSKAIGGALLVVLAVRDGEPCGYTVCTVTAAGEGEVDSIFVAPEVRRHGIGDAMMARAMPWLHERSRAGIWVDVLSCNDAALRFYERYGFHARTVRMRHVPAQNTTEAVSVSTSAVHVSENPEPEPEAPPPVALEYRTARMPAVDPMETPSAARRGPRQVIPLEFDVVIAHTQDQAAAAAIEQQLKKEGIPVYRTHDGPVVDQTIDLIVREADRDRGMEIAEAIFSRRRRIKSFPRQAPK